MRGSTAGIADNFKGSKRRHYVLLSVLDTMLSALVVSPGVVGYWRGTWCVMDYYVFPQHPSYTAWVSIAIGFFGHMFFTLLQRQFTRYFHPDEHRLVYYVVSRVYTTIFGFVCVNSWRGAWKMLDHYTGLEVWSVTSTMVASAVILAAMRTLRNISAPPFSIVTDNCEGYFQVPTMFRVSGSRETSLYVLDCLFSVLIVGTLVVFVWRGAWTVLDLYLYPSHADWSAWASLALGYAIVVLTFSLQTPLKGLCGRLEGFWRVCVVDVYLFFSFCGTVNVWRGIWMLLNIYFLPGNPAASYWITHAGCLLILVLINCSNSILVRGVYIDAEEEGGKCAVFPCYYLRLFFQNKRKEKLQQLQIQQQQQQKAPLVATSAKRKSDGDKHLPGSVVLDIQPNSANHVQAPLMGIPLETLQDIPESLL
ncbi:uncharacterized protein fusl isoform X2 [Periplaneta americana]|uniref:uncharacterized protein fusl isoform X2 n=1 Tax=Periplaneta americana TaxID=6978 RepID=UPI0037E91BB3